MKIGSVKMRGSVRRESMAYLNWKTSNKGIFLSAQPQGPMVLKLELGQTEIENLIPILEAIYRGEERELRLDLPSGWLLFWKRREEGNRILLAHPAEKEWVGTLALETSFGEKILSSLKDLKTLLSIHLNQLGTLDSMSNLEIQLFYAA